MEVLWLEQYQADLPSDDVWLSDSEKLRCSSLFVPKRRADWRLGRWTAKHAIASRFLLPHNVETLATIEIRPDASGVPEIFLGDRPASVRISISHSAGVAVCAIGPADAAVGCDLELVEPRDRAFTSDYFTDCEQEMILRAAKPEYDTLVTLLWSAKESALKALRTGLRFDTRCVTVKFTNQTSLIADDWSPLSVLGPDEQVLTGWWRCSSKLVRTIVTIPSAAPPALVTPSALWSPAR